MSQKSMRPSSQISLTQAQEEALRLDRHVLVEAGAGSGKTTILVQRILKICDTVPECTPHHILAITFTKKAAQELLDRIQHQLLADTDRFSDDRRRQLLASLRTASITTIHGFCAKILMQYAIDAGLDPQFSVMEEADGIFDFQDTIQEVSQSLLDRQDPRLEQYLMAFSFKQFGQDLMSLKARAQDVLAFYATRQTTPQTQEKYNLEAHRDSAMSGLKSKGERRVGEAASSQNAIGDVLDFEAILSAQSASASAKADMPPPDDIPDEVQRAIQKREQLTDVILSIFAECYAVFQEKKQAKSVLDYDDLVLLAHRLVTQSPAIAKALRTHYRYIMLDEFQDTDARQWELIQAITGPLSGIGILKFI